MHQLLIEKDVVIPVRDGATIYADVFRPAEGGEYPVIMTLGPYPKDVHFKDWNPVAWENLPEKGEHMHWETVNPEWWVPHGYVVIRCDTRGRVNRPVDLDSSRERRPKISTMPSSGQERRAGATARSG